MTQRSIVTLLTPWRLRRLAEAERLTALRRRDGDACARCRRPMRFDLTAGHDQGFVVEPVAHARGMALDNLRLCHPRCIPSGVDHTGEVTERVRRRNEAALFPRARGRRKTAA